jgi:3',5'-cyclic AMP phosphodiesterase CpdA
MKTITRMNVISRRQALSSIAAITASSLIKPAAILGTARASDTIRFAVIGDWGAGDRHCVGIANQMFATMRSAPFEFIVTAGDNIYPNGSGRYFTKHFEQPYAGFLKERVSFHAVLGNHDVESGRQDQCHYPLFNMGGQRYYTIRKGGGLAELFMLDSTDFDSSQAGWLENALRCSSAKWKVAVFHHPLYSSAKKHGSAIGLRKQLEQMLIRYRVNLVFSGHDHVYERVKPQQGVQYFVSGGGGKVRRGDVDLRSDIRAASFDDDNHFMVIEIRDTRVDFAAISETGHVVDKGEVRLA